MNHFKNYSFLLGLSAAVLSSSIMAASHPQVAPFTDTLHVHFNNFPAAGVAVGYQDDRANDVHIRGDRNHVSSGNSSFNVYVSSVNWFTGYPSMHLQLHDTTSPCVITFIDGAWVNSLDFANGAPPSDCPHFRMSGISKNGYDYTMNITYSA